MWSQGAIGATCRNCPANPRTPRVDSSTSPLWRGRSGGPASTSPPEGPGSGAFDVLPPGASVENSTLASSLSTGGCCAGAGWARARPPAKEEKASAAAASSAGRAGARGRTPPTLSDPESVGADEGVRDDLGQVVDQEHRRPARG